ncbi:MAG: MoxR family ATPase [Desulfobacteraceae bacterium]|nr:MoxR family ATPase [Desulfobacteraceae bacterium]
MNEKEQFNRLMLLEKEVKKAVTGQDDVVREIIICLIAGGHALVEGVPGLGKTLLVRSIAAAINSVFKRIQFTPDLMPSDISGHMMFELKTNTFKVRKGPVFCNLLLGDEINRAPAKTQSALLEVMQEQQVSIEGKSFGLKSPFFVLATQNPIEHEGTYPLPKAQLDRFLLNTFIDYPNLEDEEAIVKKVTLNSIGDKLDVSAIKPVLTGDQIVELQQFAATLKTDDKIMNYAVRIIRATRESSGIEIGAGPRGSISLLRAGRANALLKQNSFVTPDDIKEVALPVLRHRIKLTTDLEIEGYKPDDILNDILQEVDAPRT